MNADPVLIEDDDVDMEQPVVVIEDEDDVKIISEERVNGLSATTVETIDLDDETPSITRDGTVENNNTSKNVNESEMDFINNLNNNRLMDRIVKRCVSMENAIGMPRVIYKTLLPLYRDTNSTFKKSDSFRTLLKKTYKQLTRDPDHKFLHIKTLCEELKSGVLRKKVPFVTLATNLKKNISQQDNEGITSICREIDQSNEENISSHKVYSNDPLRNHNTRKRVICCDQEKTDIIDLDDSETESVDVNSSESDNCPGDVIILEETESSDHKNDEQNIVPQGTLEKDSKKENNDKNSISSDFKMDYELLIPKRHAKVLPIDYEESGVLLNNIELVTRLEKKIASYKKMIDYYEEAEVTTESSNNSAYCLCAKYKENLVKCYKQICEIKGNSNDIVKRCEIRLHVADGHPPGPAKMLEFFLNSTIDKTGAVEFPDFSDVVKCVVESNRADNLAWSRQRVIREAVALFRQCGQALRKRRQKREYRDLLSLIRDNEEIDDPAEKDPILLAKLEENKLIAKKKEEEILERYVGMEKNSSSRRAKFKIPPRRHSATFESDNDSSDSESEQNITLPSNMTTATNNQPETEEWSRSNISLALLLTNNTIITSSSCKDQSGPGQRSKTNDDTVSSSSPQSPMLATNLLIAPSTPQNFDEDTTTNENKCAIRESLIFSDVTSSSDSHLNGLPKNTKITTPDTMHDEKEAMECSDKEEIDSESELTIPETVVKFNTEAGNENCEMSLISATKNTESAERPANNEPCIANDVRSIVSSIKGEGACTESDSSIYTSVQVKTEDNVRNQPLDIQSMLNELGDSFICEVFDIEDPFLVIDISSDGFSDDDQL